MASTHRRTPTKQQSGNQRVQSPPRQNGGHHSIPLTSKTSTSRRPLIASFDMHDAKKSYTTYNNVNFQLIPVEIEKDAEIGLVIGQVEGEQWVFIDEILPNGMIDMHGVLKENDYLIQVGNYSLDGVDVTAALVLIERAYDEGRKSLAFVAAREDKSEKSKQTIKDPNNRKVPIDDTPLRKESRAQSFVDYENEKEEEPIVEVIKPKPKSKSNRRPNSPRDGSKEPEKYETRF